MSSGMLELVRKMIVLLVGSGIFLNASYIYGWGFYTGYLEQFGFEYSFFPIEWNKSNFWAYYASRALGISIFDIYIQASPLIIISIVISCYIFVVWVGGSKKENNNHLSPAEKFFLRLRAFDQVPSFIRYTFQKIEWVLTNKNSIRGIVVSYGLLLFLFVLPILALMWAFYPNLGSEHGQRFVAGYQERLGDSFCSEYETRWTPCIKIEFENGEVYEGLSIVKNENVLGLYTEDGPVMLTLPEQFIIKKANKAS